MQFIGTQPVEVLSLHRLILGYGLVARYTVGVAVGVGLGPQTILLIVGMHIEKWPAHRLCQTIFILLSLYATNFACGFSC